MAIVKRRLGKNKALIAESERGKKASDVIALAGKEGIATEPLDITRLVRNLGIDISYEEMDNNISGHLKKNAGEWMITINQNHHEKRQRFTIAHELGHYFLHGKRKFDFWDETTVLFRNNGSTPMEWEANRFAAELLMPEDVFRRKVGEGKKRIDELAEFFNVSALSVRIRAKQLNFQGHGL